MNLHFFTGFFHPGVSPGHTRWSGCWRCIKQVVAIWPPKKWRVSSWRHSNLAAEASRMLRKTAFGGDIRIQGEKTQQDMTCIVEFPVETLEFFFVFLFFLVFLPTSYLNPTFLSWRILYIARNDVRNSFVLHSELADLPPEEAGKNRSWEWSTLVVERHPISCQRCWRGQMWSFKRCQSALPIPSRIQRLEMWLLKCTHVLSTFMSENFR